MKVEKPAVASMFKYYGTEHNKRRHEALMVKPSGINGLAFGTVMNLTKMKKTSHVPGYELKVIQ